MVKEGFFGGNLDWQLDSLASIGEKISFLKNYLEENDNIPLETKAWIYEKLGDLYHEDKLRSGEYYKKSAFAWENAAYLKSGSRADLHIQREDLRRSVRVYKKAMQVYGVDSGSVDLKGDVKRKIKETKRELRRYNSVPKRITILGTLLSFVLSISFLSLNFTGFSVIGVEPSSSNLLGAILFFSGLFGLFLVLIWER